MWLVTFVDLMYFRAFSGWFGEAVALLFASFFPLLFPLHSQDIPWMLIQFFSLSSVNCEIKIIHNSISFHLSFPHTVWQRETENRSPPQLSRTASSSHTPSGLGGSRGPSLFQRVPAESFMKSRGTYTVCLHPKNCLNVFKRKTDLSHLGFKCKLC